MENIILELIKEIATIGHIDVGLLCLLSCKNKPVLVKSFNKIHMILKYYVYMNFIIQNLLYNEKWFV